MDKLFDEKVELVEKSKTKPWLKFISFFLILIFLIVLTIVYFVFASFFPDIRGRTIPQSLTEIKNFYLNVYTTRFLATVPLFIIQSTLTFFAFKPLISFRKASIIAIVLLFLSAGYFANSYFSSFKHYVQNWENLVSYVEYPNTQPKISGTFGCNPDSANQRRIEFITKDNFETVRNYYESRILPGYQIVESNLTLYDYDPSKINMEPDQEIPGIRIRYQLPLGNNSFGPEYSVNIVPEEPNIKIVAKSSECSSYDLKADFPKLKALQTSTSPSPPNETVYTEDSRSANWKTYSGKFITFKHPPDFNKCTQPDWPQNSEYACFELPTSGNTLSSIRFQVIKPGDVGAPNYSFEEFKNKIVENGRKSQVEINNFDYVNINESTIDDQKALIYDQIQLKIYPALIRTAWIKKDVTQYFISWEVQANDISSRDSFVSQNSQKFDQILATLKFTETSQESVLKIPEYGVQITLSDEIKDAYYINTTTSKGYVYLKVHSLDTEPQCKKDDSSTASLSRVGKDEINPMTNGKFSDSFKGKVIGNYFYYIDLAQYSCADTTEGKAKLEKVRSAFTTAEITQ